MLVLLQIIGALLPFADSLAMLLHDSIKGWQGYQSTGSVDFNLLATEAISLVEAAIAAFSDVESAMQNAYTAIRTNHPDMPPHIATALIAHATSRALAGGTT